MKIVVTHWALRYGEWQERLLYFGSSTFIASVVAWFAKMFFVQGFDVVLIEERSARPRTF